MYWEELSSKNSCRETAFKEIRLHKDKPPQEFTCRLLHREKDYLVLYYHIHHPFTITDREIKKGSSTIAHYWENRNYALWKFKDASHHLLGYLFHVCNKTAIGKTFVSYEDLELDIWFDPDGTPIILDQDEVDDCSTRGLIDAEERDLINRQKNHILKNFKNIIQSIWAEDQ